MKNLIDEIKGYHWTPEEKTAGSGIEKQLRKTEEGLPATDWSPAPELLCTDPSKVNRYCWVSALAELPPKYEHGMSLDVLTIAGSKMSVKCYDHELGTWSGSPHVTVTHWMELPSPPCQMYKPDHENEL